jgi:hypothetical protein
VGKSQIIVYFDENDELLNQFRRKLSGALRNGAIRESDLIYNKLLKVKMSPVHLSIRHFKSSMLMTLVFLSLLLAAGGCRPTDSFKAKADKAVSVGVPGVWDDPFNEKTAAAHARKLLVRKLASSEPFKGLSETEKIKTLLFFSFNFCTNSQPHTGQKNINDLFTDCKSACGGFSYVLRGLLASQKIKSRFVNLYNVPIQGNHTLVEAEYAPNRWMLVDPTFGTYFSIVRQKKEKYLSLDEVRLLSQKEIAKAAKTTEKRSDFTNNTANGRVSFFQDSFNFPNMAVGSYIEAEGAIPVGQGIPMLQPLVMTLDLKSGIEQAGDLSATSLQHGREAWLKWSNRTLQNENPSDDTSYLFHIVGDYPPYFESLNIIKLEKLQPKEFYEIEIAGISELGKKAQLSIVSLGKNIIIPFEEPIILKEGRFTIKRQFFAKKNNGEICLKLVEPKDKNIAIFGVRVRQL